MVNQPERTDDDGERWLRRKQAALLWILGVLGGAAVLPYAFALQGELLRPYLQKSGLSLLQLGVIASAQTAAMLLVTVPIGLWAARRVGWKAPLTEALCRREPIAPLLTGNLLIPVILGLLAGLAMMLLDLAWFLPKLPELQTLNRSFAQRAPVSYGALATLYGAVTEELLLRLFVMSLIALLLKTIAGKRSERTEIQIMILWAANIVAALLFGLGHLPAAKVLLPMTPLLVVRTLLLNSVVGVLCGWLFARKGLEFAMLAHGCADVVLHVVAPLLVLAGLIAL